MRVTVPAQGTAVRRASLVTLDQGLSSASNLVVLIWSAHALSPADFGRFSLVFFIYVFTQGGVVRSLVSWTVVVHPEDADSRPRSVLGAAVLLCAGVGVLCVAIGLTLAALGSTMGVPVLLLGALMPLLGVQDVGRFMGFAQARPVRAVVLDGLWLGLTVAAFVLIGVLHEPTLFWMVGGWAGTGALAGVWVFVQHGVPRARDLSPAWLRDRWSFSWRSLLAASSSGAVSLVGSALMALVSGPLAVAAVRAALLLERPSTAVQNAVATSAMADIARERPDNRGLLAHQRRTMLIAGAVAALNGAVLVLVPDSVGELLLGNVWALVSPLLLIVVLRLLTTAAQSGVRACLMGRRQIRSVMVIDIASTVLIIVGLVIGAAIGDEWGALLGGLVGQVIAAVAWWVALIRHLRGGFQWSDLDDAVPVPEEAVLGRSDEVESPPAR